jgi:hypothetical protein
MTTSSGIVNATIDIGLLFIIIALIIAIAATLISDKDHD